MTEDIMRTIKTGYCPSLSGRATLTYHVGWLEGKISFRLHENSSGGLFSKEWVSLERLSIEEGKPISSTTIQSMFSGRSSNTGGFLLAALLNEGLIKPIEGIPSVVFPLTTEGLFFCLHSAAFLGSDNRNETKNRRSGRHRLGLVYVGENLGPDRGKKFYPFISGLCIPRPAG